MVERLSKDNEYILEVGHGPSQTDFVYTLEKFTFAGKTISGNGVADDDRPFKISGNVEDNVLTFFVEF